MAEKRLPLPGRPSHFVHFVLLARTEEAWIAVYSTGSTTATRLPLTTTCVLGNCFLSSLPTEISFDPRPGGCTTRACSMPGSRTSPTYVAWPDTIGGIVRIGIDWPTTLYWPIGFVGGLPSTVRPRKLVASPVTGIDRLSALPPTSWP